MLLTLRRKRYKLNLNVHLETAVRVTVFGGRAADFVSRMTKDGRATGLFNEFFLDPRTHEKILSKFHSLLYTSHVVLAIRTTLYCRNVD
jgi:hypothetical protein